MKVLKRQRLFLVLVFSLALLLGIGIATAAGSKIADCQNGEDNTFVEQMIDADCNPEDQDKMRQHISAANMPQYSLEKQTLDYGERTQVRVEIWHEDPNVNYLCQVRVNDQSWTDFVEVPRKAASSSPTVVTQTIEAPDETVPSQQSVSVQVEVFCYGPADGEDHWGWIAQTHWTETLSYTYPTSNAIQAQNEIGTAQDLVSNARETLQNARNKLDEAEQAGADTSNIQQYISDASSSLESANTYLSNAEQALQNGNYQTAISQAQSAQQQAQNAEQAATNAISAAREAIQNANQQDSTEQEQQSTPQNQETAGDDQQSQQTTAQSGGESNSDADENEFQRGFFSNKPSGALAFLTGPKITAVGFVLSIAGILLELRRGA